MKDEDLHIGRAHTARGRLGCVARGIIPGRLTPASATPPRLFIVAVGLAAVAYLLVLTPVLNRPDLPDPAAYVGAARNIASGRGITLPFVPISTDIRPSAAAELNGRAPLFQYSPGLPVALAAGRVLGMGPVQTDRIVNLVSLGVIAALVAWAVLKLTDNSYVTAGAAVFVLLTTAFFMIMFTFVTTEALFSALALAALAALAGYMSTRRMGLALAFVALAAASGLTRFVGVSVGVTGMVVIALWYPAPWRGRVARALMIGAGSIILIALWMLRDAVAAPGGGGISFHPPDPIFLSGRAMSTLVRGRFEFGWADWMRYATGIIAVVGVTGAAWATLRRAATSSPVNRPVNLALARVGFVFFAAYSGALLASMTFVHNAPSNVRYLVPLFPLIVVLAAVATRRTLGAPRTSRARSVGAWGLMVLLVVIGVLHLDASREIWTTYRSARPGPPAGRGSWAPVLRSLPSNAVIFTNAPNTVEPETGRFAVAMPTRESIWSGKENRHYRADLIEIGDVLCTRPGAVLLIGSYAGFEAAKLDRIAGLEVTDRLPDSVILRPDPERCAAPRP